MYEYQAVNSSSATSTPFWLRTSRSQLAAPAKRWGLEHPPHHHTPRHPNIPPHFLDSMRSRRTNE